MTCEAVRARDHPRIRGEHVGLAWEGVKAVGSSPHTRGAPERSRAGRDPGRIIPAYAGSTPRTRSTPKPPQDHPRIRGEHKTVHISVNTFEGSSPHTRGARSEERIGVIPARIIPAYAGSTASAPSKTASNGDHPRIRGEHPHWSPDRWRQCGSSPHTRGARPQPPGPIAEYRIIPAYAGSTRPGSGRRRRLSDHPRIRGEHWDSVAAELTPTGSSPHTRGALVRPRRRHVRRRIIPAYAGSTPSGAAGTSSTWDHPRIRGEHVENAPNAVFEMGSSPHTRGARVPDPRSEGGAGIIPAYAGSTGSERGHLDL